MPFNLDFISLYKIRRPKLGIPRGDSTHWGLAIYDGLTGQWWVFHTTPQRGTHLTSLQNFAANLQYDLVGVPLTPGIRSRLAHAIVNPRPYDPVFANCQQVVTSIVDGRPWSPTLFEVACGLVFAAGFVHFMYRAA